MLLGDGLACVTLSVICARGGSNPPFRTEFPSNSSRHEKGAAMTAAPLDQFVAIRPEATQLRLRTATGTAPRLLLLAFTPCFPPFPQTVAEDHDNSPTHKHYENGDHYDHENNDRN